MNVGIGACIHACIRAGIGACVCPGVELDGSIDLSTIRKKNTGVAGVLHAGSGIGLEPSVLGGVSRCAAARRERDEYTEDEDADAELHRHLQRTTTEIFFFFGHVSLLHLLIGGNGR
jgi:hypothetical protein